MNLTAKIYTLRIKGTDEIFYVGCTSKSLEERLKVHTYKLINGDEPIIELIEEVPADLAIVYEYYWIEQFKCWGFNLLNKDLTGKRTVYLFSKHRLNNNRYKIEKRINSNVLQRKFNVKTSEVYNFIRIGEVKRFSSKAGRPCVFCLNELMNYFPQIKSKLKPNEHPITNLDHSRNISPHKVLRH